MVELSFDRNGHIEINPNSRPAKILAICLQALILEVKEGSSYSFPNFNATIIFLYAVAAISVSPCTTNIDIHGKNRL